MFFWHTLSPNRYSKGLVLIGLTHFVCKKLILRFLISGGIRRFWAPFEKIFKKILQVSSSSRKVLSSLNYVMYYYKKLASWLLWENKKVHWTKYSSKLRKYWKNLESVKMSEAPISPSFLRIPTSFIDEPLLKICSEIQIHLKLLKIKQHLAKIANRNFFLKPCDKILNCIRLRKSAELLITICMVILISKNVLSRK